LPYWYWPSPVIVGHGKWPRSTFLSLVVLLRSPSFEGANVGLSLIGHLPKHSLGVLIIDHRREAAALPYAISGLLN